MSHSPTRRSGRNPRLFAAAALLLVPVLAGCGSDSGAQSADDTASSSGGEPLSVVASTNVWGDIAESVGGDDVQVTSIIDDPSQDPHSFEADSKTLLSISKADVVVENGGGYDDFMDTMLESADSSATVLNAVDISGKTAPADGELNEHVWYDLPSVVKVAQQISEELGKADPDRASQFQANADAFDDEVSALIDKTAQDEPTVSGKGIAITEPVPLYLTEALGLVNETPEEFSEAVEEGDDVPVAVLKETTDLFASGDIAALVYNAQTTGPVTEQVESAATDASVAVVPVTETLPQGQTYVEWMGGNLDSIVAAVEGS